jgi:ABC-type transport system involved in cytochrome c biogenesis permease subunit
MDPAMASNTISDEANPFNTDQADPDAFVFGPALKKILAPIASLKLTVSLFAMAIFIVLAGTLAQVDKDIWEVVDGYFRTAFAWIDVRIFFPPSFFPGMSVPERVSLPGGLEFPLGFYFPGGWLIGSLMAINLLAAHGLRFKVQASGTRLVAGFYLIGVGLLVTWLVIVSGSNKGGVQSEPWIEWSTLWGLLKAGLVVLWLGTVTACLKLQPQQRIERWTLIAFGTVLGGLLCWLLFQGDAATLNDSSMRILWQLLKGTFAGLVLLGGCVMVFKKRAGVVLLHGGVGLMMFSELLVGTQAVEGQMTIQEAETVNFVQDIRTLELAIIDPSDPDQDIVWVVPQSMLLSQSVLSGEEVIRHDDWPFELRLVKFLKNSVLKEVVKPDDANPATAGAGLFYFVKKVKPGSGTDVGSSVDVASAYIEFTDELSSKSLGTRLLSQHLKPEKITLDNGKTYEVFLRFKRNYKPYSMHLIDVRKDDYIGTNTPRNFASQLQLVDEDRGVDRAVKIWMNNPLRFAGETFYQSGYFADPKTGVETTTLQVVTNTGWMIPYVSCMIVAIGLLAHFSIALVRFLTRLAAADPAFKTVKAAVEPVQMAATKKTKKGKHKRQNKNGKNSLEPAADDQALATQDGLLKLASVLFPVLIVVFCATGLGFLARPPSQPDGEMKLYEFGKLPLVFQGRVKPIDSLARNSLRVISGKQTFVDAAEKTQPAIRWLLDVIAKPRQAFQHKVFRIENLEVLDLLGLQRRKGFRYSFEEFGEKLPELTEQAKRAGSSAASQLSVYQKKILELENKIGVLDLLIQSYAQPNLRPDPQQAREDLFNAIRQQKTLAKRNPSPPLAIPPASEEDKWETYAVAWTQDLIRSISDQAPNPATESMGKILAAYASDDVQAFNSELANYQAALKSDPPENLNLDKTNFEAFFNHFEPFFYSAVLYVVTFLLAALAWLGWSRPLNRASFWLIAFTFAVHTLALISRMYISGRPPVTNLYSSAVFIGWGCVALGMILEVVYRMGIGNAIASVAGFITLVIAHFLSIDGDTFVVLQAVLDTQIWLATHVVCITLGYATTYMAGILGVFYILRGVLTPSLSANVGKEFSRMIYGTLCFAIFFSFVGTVLGGLWADDSWGRFWGWDPKENGALIIVLWNVLVLHARWGGMVKERGLAVLAVAGNIATSWSWFGVNELGVGLHSYGFTEGVLLTLGIFVGTQLVVIALGSMPKELWWSFRQQQ